MKQPTIFSIIIIIIILYGACSPKVQEEGDSNDSDDVNNGNGSDTKSVDFYKGVSLSPRSFSTDDFLDFLSLVSETGEIVTWAGDWMEMGEENGAPYAMMAFAAEYDFIPVNIAGLYSQTVGELAQSLDAASRMHYKEISARFAQEYQPHFLGFGVEMNILFERSPLEFAQWVTLFEEVVDTVRSVSPDTKIFTIFQLERMSGLRGGLFGGENNTLNHDWDLISQFPSADIIGFTTYPGLIYREPDDIPDDHYTQIPTHTMKSIAFFEIGWHSHAGPVGWESSEEEQTEFIRRFFELIGDLEPEMTIWPFIFDQNVTNPFHTMGLRRTDGSAKPSWNEWIAIDNSVH